MRGRTLGLTISFMTLLLHIAVACALHVSTGALAADQDQRVGISAGETVLKQADGSIEATYHYRLVQPSAEAIAAPGARVALVVFMHGSGERGADNAAQLTHFAGNCASADFQKRAPCYLLAMQCPANEVWAAADIQGARDRGDLPAMAAQPTRVMRALMQAIDEVMASKAVDPSRVYATGLSLGGFGTYDLVARRPELFAAAVPICGGGDPATAANLARVPFYIVHGEDDPVVPVSLARVMREAIAGASAAAWRTEQARVPISNTPMPKPKPMPRPMPKRAPNPMYREYEHVGHDSWTPAYRFGEDGVLDWMFAQVKGATTTSK